MWEQKTQNKKSPIMLKGLRHPGSGEASLYAAT